MRKAVIDVGSNSIHLIIYEISGENVSQLIHQKESGGLIRYIQNDTMIRKGIKKLISILGDYKQVCNILNVETIHCFATASLRNITNQDEVLKEIKEVTGIEIDVISGHKESNLGFVGLLQSFKCTYGITMDMGGGSTEILKFKENQFLNLVSLPFGCLSLYQNYVSGMFPTKQEIKAIKLYIKSQLDQTPWVYGIGSTAYLTGGTAKSIAKIHNELFSTHEKIHGYTLTMEEFTTLTKYLINDYNNTAKLITKVIPERAHTIIPGIIAYNQILKKSCCDQIIISESGIREGYVCKEIIK